MKDDIAIVSWSPPAIVAAYPAIQALFAAAFAMPASEAASFTDHIARHAQRPDFRFLAALDPADKRLLGFVYGYTTAPGQWFQDTIRPALGPALAARWLDGAFEFTEFAVLPAAQGRGIGGRLHDAVLADLPHRRAILSTYDEPSAALALYRRRGWRALRSDYHFPGIERPYLLMGRDLAGGRGEAYHGGAGGEERRYRA